VILVCSLAGPSLDYVLGSISLFDTSIVVLILVLSPLPCPASWAAVAVRYMVSDVGTVCLSPAPGLRCVGLSLTEEVITLVPVGLEVIFSLGLIFAGRDAGRCVLGLCG
jgi:hypothetical protein